MSVNERLKNVIDSQGRKYGWVAEQCGIPPSTMSEIINGKRKLTADEVVLLCNALHISASVLIPTKFDTVA